MEQYVDQIAKDVVEKNLQRYWPGFELAAFALYNQNNVYLFNHPRCGDTPYIVLAWNEQFVGNTLTLYEGYPTAIADMKYFTDYEGLYSIMAHELFHGFQYRKEEKRFPNELLGVTYPLTLENTDLRNQERRALYQAVMQPDLHKKKQFLADFIELREKRAELIGEHLDYELLIETVEGPARYVEFKAYSEKSPLSSEQVLQNYGGRLLNVFESASKIRLSTYSSGLYMCLLLDELEPAWKNNFFIEKDVTVYDLIKKFVGKPTTNSIKKIEISQETIEVVNGVMLSRKKEIDEFEGQAGIQLVIEGEMTAFNFDPMNITLYEGKLLHKNFIKVKINNNDYFFSQPVIAYINDGIRNIKKLHLFLKENPIEKAGSLYVPGIGDIKGQYNRQGNTYHLMVEKF